MLPITTQKEIITATNILAKAYAQAPNIMWFLGEASSKKLGYFFSSLVKDAHAKNGAYLTKNQCGVLLLYDMQAKQFSVSAIFRKMHLVLFVLGIKKSIKLIQQQKWQSQFRPKEGLYGMALAIRDDEQRWQTTLEMKQGFLEISKKHQLPIYVETTNERIVKLYKTIGFTTYHKARHPYTELDVWFMKMEQPQGA